MRRMANKPNPVAKALRILGKKIIRSKKVYSRKRKWGI